MSSLSVIIGTTGRSSLRRTIESVVSQRMPHDEIVLVSANWEVVKLANHYGCKFRLLSKPGGDWGDTERQRGMEVATGEYVCFLDDDDMHVPGARQLIEDAITEHPGKPLMFRMRFGEQGHVLFLEPEVKLGNVGTPMCVLPNDKSKLGRWGMRKERGGDFDFMSSMKWAPSEIVWIRQVLAVVTPERIQGEVVSTESTRPLRVLLVHPGATWSTADVEDGLRYGLEYHGVEVIRYRLDTRIDRAGRWLYSSWRHARKSNPDITRPSKADVLYQASEGVLAMALRKQVDVVLVVSAMCLHPDAIILMKRAGLRVVVLFTETPYDIAQELRIAAMVDGCWTNERTAVQDFLDVNPNSSYLPHAWHPERHSPDAALPDDVPSHDVVFVGSGFPDRISFMNAVNWDGIDLGLYGTWKDLGLNARAEACIKSEEVPNAYASALYRKAKVGVNLYRAFKGFGRTAERVTRADSLSPRAYELAACGVFHISQHRAEVTEVFGDLVPTFQSPSEAEALIRTWLKDDAGRRRVSEALPARVAESTWVRRAATVIGDVQTLLTQPVKSAA